MCLALLAIPANDRGSLQDFLLRAREQRELALSVLRSKVDELLREIDAAALGRDQSALVKLGAKLTSIGPECAVLVVPRLEPGAAPSDAQKLAASTLATALQGMPSDDATRELVNKLETCSADGRANIILALSGAKDSGVAAKALSKLWLEGPVESRAASLIALARMEAPEAKQALDAALADPRPEISKMAVNAIVASASAAQAPRMLALLRTPGDAGRNIDAIARYYKLVPQALDDQAVAAIISLAGDPGPRPEDRSRLLESLANRAKEFTSDIKRSLRKLAETPGGTMSESARMLLAIGGDAKAKRDVLANYEVIVQRNPDWPPSYEARAGVLYRMQEWKEARADWQKALELAARDPNGKQDSAAIGIARCWMQEGKPREAAEMLRKAPLTPKQLAELARDPLFAPLLDNPKLRDSLLPN